MHIGILTHNYPKTSDDRKDAGIFIYDFAHELAKHAKVSVFCPDFSGRKELYKRVPVTWFDWGGSKEKFGSWSPFSPLSVLNFFKLIINGQKAALNFAKKNEVDLCLACWALPSAVFARKIKKELRIPYSVWSLGSDLNKYAKYPILRQMIRASLEEADFRFANSYLLVDKVKKLSEKGCSFMPAVTEFNVGRVRPAHLEGGKFNFLFVGRLERIKGPDVLIEACARLRKKDSGFRVHILGDGSMRSELKGGVRKRGLGNFVDFFGAANKEEVASYMKTADCLVIPSRSESLPLVLIEATKVGLPIIAADVGDCRRLIKKYKIGRLVPKEAPQKLADAMLKMMRERTPLKKRHKKGLDKIAKEFTQKGAVDIFLKTVYSLL